MKRLMNFFKVAWPFIVVVATLLSLHANVKKYLPKTSLYGEIVDPIGRKHKEIVSVELVNQPQINDHRVCDGMFILEGIVIPNTKFLKLRINLKDGSSRLIPIDLRECEILDGNVYSCGVILAFQEDYDTPLFMGQLKPDIKHAYVFEKPSAKSKKLTEIPAGASFEVKDCIAKSSIVGDKVGQWCEIKYQEFEGFLFSIVLEEAS